MERERGRRTTDLSLNVVRPFVKESIPLIGCRRKRLAKERGRSENRVAGRATKMEEDEKLTSTRHSSIEHVSRVDRIGIDSVDVGSSSSHSRMRVLRRVWVSERVEGGSRDQSSRLVGKSPEVEEEKDRRDSLPNDVRSAHRVVSESVVDLGLSVGLFEGVRGQLRFV